METTIEAPAAPALSIVLPQAIPNSAAMMDRSNKLLAFVKSLTITSPEDLREAADELARIKGRIKDLTDMRMSITRPIDEAKKNAMAVFAGPTQVLEQAESILKTTIGTYQAEQERKAREAQAAAEREARRQRDEAEAKAREAEAKARAETERIQREADEKAAALQAEAEAAAASGNEEQAAALQAQAEEVTSVAVAQVEEVQEEAAAIVTAKQMEAEVVMPVVVAAPTKVAGLSSAKKWKGKVVDLRALLQAALTDDTLFALIDINESRLNSLARTLNNTATKPGIEFYPDTTIRSRAA